MTLRQAANTAAERLAATFNPALKALGPVWLTAAALMFFGLWLAEHNASVRRAAELAETKKQAAAAVSQLQARASQAERQANVQNAQAVENLEAQRKKLDERARELDRLAAALEQQERKSASQAAAMTSQEVLKELEERLGPGGIAESGLGAGDLGLGKAEGRSQKPEGRSEESEEMQNLPPRFARPFGDSPITNHRPPIGNSSIANRHSAIENRQSQSAPSLHPPAPSPEPPVPGPALSLSEAGARQIESALAELDACRGQSKVAAEQLGTCRQQGAVTMAIADEQKASLAKLNDALQAKDQILAERETEFRAQLKAARGSWPQRLFHTLEHVGIGVVIGVGLAVK